ncbi:MAG: hypothetical protein SPL13_02540, partial [Clostridia bacterium]|nr:hypothetical protein [Clostridia bacterium]
MTKKQSTASVKFKSIIAFILLFLLSFTLFFISACGETTAEEDTVYKKVENDDSSITNGSFEFGTADIAISDLPQTASLTGWGGVSTEN